MFCFFSLHLKTKIDLQQSIDQSANIFTIFYYINNLNHSILTATNFFLKNYKILVDLITHIIIILISYYESYKN